jgi:hypothetical protein
VFDQVILGVSALVFISQGSCTAVNGKQGKYREDKNNEPNCSVSFEVFIEPGCFHKDAYLK